jgi:hypothetical protein
MCDDGELRPVSIVEWAAISWTMAMRHGGRDCASVGTSQPESSVPRKLMAFRSMKRRQ